MEVPFSLFSLRGVKMEFSFKELYQVVLKATSNIEIDGKVIQPNETIAAFDKIQLANFRENVDVRTAHGGYRDLDRVWWESPKNIDLTFTQGIFSKIQFALMTNSRLLRKADESSIYINKRVIKDADDEGNVVLDEEPFDYFFIYDMSTGLPVEYTQTGELQINVGLTVKSVLLDYASKYDNNADVLCIGAPLIQNCVYFEGRTRVKEDITGQVKTGILTIPKLKLMSDLSIRIGKDATPVVGTLHAVAIPFGARGNTRIMEMTFLEEDIDTDI